MAESFKGGAHWTPPNFFGWPERDQMKISHILLIAAVAAAVVWASNNVNFVEKVLG